VFLNVASCKSCWVARQDIFKLCAVSAEPPLASIIEMGDGFAISLEPDPKALPLMHDARKVVVNRKDFQTQNKSTFGDPWRDAKIKANPQTMPIASEHPLLEADPSLAHEAIAQAGSPGAKVLGGASGTARLHPLNVLLKDELKIKPAFDSALCEHIRDAVALMLWFHSPTFG
jgi:hypothetical protein